MTSPYYLAMAALLGLVTTSSPLIGAAIGLHAPFSKRPLACLLAFAAVCLLNIPIASALAIELAYEGAQSLHHQGFSARTAWAFVSTGFAAGAVIYYFASLFLEKRGAAVRYVTQFREFALARKHADTSERIRLLSSSDLMRHLPPEDIEPILESISGKRLANREILFRAGDEADALYIVAQGKVEVLNGATADTFSDPSRAITASDPADKGMMFEPAESKIYRHPTFYEVPDEVGHM